jgi:hypothetical protein
LLPGQGGFCGILVSHPAHDVADLDLHDITAAQLAVDGKIEQRPIP